MTNILALKPGHDGAVAFLADGDLLYSLEGEKDSHDRNGAVTAELIVEALSLAPAFPDVVALGGWHKVLPGLFGATGAGYEGLAPGELWPGRWLGRDVQLYSSSHERSHLYGGVALSPFNPDADLAILVWEGVIGAFYRWNGPRAPVARIDVLDQPGARYSALFCLADEGFPDSGGWPPSAAAGKLMAIAGLADEQPPARDSVQVVESLLKVPSLYPFHKGRYRQSALYNCGVTDPEFCRAARYLSDRLFDIFLDAARTAFEPGLPLVVVGGCGLNCDWNRNWRESGLFSDVFVPPVANDAGSALGTAVDAQVQVGGLCHVTWDVYRGAEFVHDADAVSQGWQSSAVDLAQVSEALEAGSVVAWVQGRYEIGPRALGHRSLLASAADPLSHKRLNTIKRREPYRPIAPVCREEDLGLWFDPADPDPHMLFFRRVIRPEEIPSATHVDGSARVQSVTETSAARLYELLTVHEARTSVGVLCNTSLNFNGKGFINRTSDLLHYCDLTGVDDMVIGDRAYTRIRRADGDPVPSGGTGV